MSYDFSDSAVYRMVRETHQPVEVPASNEAVDPIRLKTVCTLDHEEWPCEAVRELREFDKVRAPNDDYLQSPPQYRG